MAETTPEGIRDPNKAKAQAKQYAVSGYSTIPFIPYLLATFVVAAPIMYFRATRQEQWVWKYVFLIMLSLAVYYSGSLGRFQTFMANLSKGISK